jgi:hypothetical protein
VKISVLAAGLLLRSLELRLAKAAIGTAGRANFGCGPRDQAWQQRSGTFVGLQCAIETLRSGAPRHWRGVVAPLIYVWIGAQPAAAVDSTWTGASSGDWNTNSNWSNAAVPSGTASFDSTGLVKTITFSSAATSIGTMQFNSAATDYTFTIFNPTGQTVVLNGLGIVNSAGGPTINLSSGFLSSFLLFANGSGAGNAILNNNGFLGGIRFANFSSAQNAVITNNFANLSFRNSSTAANATIFNYGALGTTGTTFFDTSTAANATILNSGGTGITIFRDHSTAANAAIDNQNCGETQFNNFSTAASAHINVGTCGGVSFGDASTAANAVITNRFIAEFGQTATAGNAIITTINGGLTDFHNLTTAGNATLVTLDAREGRRVSSPTEPASSIFR